MMRIALLGQPGVGKGTQAVALAKKLNILHISCGDLLRLALTQGSELGKQAKAFMDKGELVPDNLVGELIQQRLSQEDAQKGFVLDGYPRNINQAVELDKMLSSSKQEIDIVLNLQASQSVIIQRLSGRRICSGCQANFHIKNMPPKKEGICDYCGGKLYRRPDDNEETIENRLKVYQQETFSLIEYYKNKNILQTVAADDEADIVLQDILQKLNGKFKDF